MGPSASFWHLVAPLVGLAANVSCQVTMCRLRFTGLLRSVVIGFALGILVTAGIDLWALLAFVGRQGDQAWLLALNVFLSGILGYSYFHFVNLGETARRTRLMRELLAAPQGLTQEELLTLYNARAVIANRLNRLIAKRQIQVRNGRLFVSNSPMLYISLAMTLIKQVVLGKKSENFLEIRATNKP